jgi:organic radical activating enzyme
MSKHLTDNKAFCVAPWIHIHTSPSGVAAPCCISNSCGQPDGVGNAHTQSLTEIVNSPKMNELRKDMLAGIKNPECSKCYDHEDSGIRSSRLMLNQEFAQYADEAIEDTNTDGTLNNFKMRYFDIRFSNICNQKCRTCGPGFSTLWEQEEAKRFPIFDLVPKRNDEFLNDVVGQIENMKSAYFAGGEPLITEEHYILLEEMIRQGKTDIRLRYNTNMSNIKFKDKDILDLWKHFDNKVEVYASIDHYGERAEYIRHGCDWAKIEENFIAVKKTPYINIQINTVLSVFNYLTLQEFYTYLIDKELYTRRDFVYPLYNMSTPVELAAHILPTHLKEIGKVKMDETVKMFKSMNFKKEAISQLENANPWVFSQDTWHEHKFKFIKEVRLRDKIRGEDFSHVFPELRTMLDERKARFPV